MKYIDADKCPACGSELRFDVHTSKKHCLSCGRIWTFEPDIENNKYIIREWKIKYIDAEKLITEFRRRMKICHRIATDERSALDTRYFYRGKTIAYSEVIHSIKLQQEQPLLPNNLDDAAKEYVTCHFRNKEFPTADIAFKARAEWMASQVQPKKDTSLTWEDIDLIIRLSDEVITEAGGTPMDFAKETLRRFNEQRNK